MARIHVLGAGTPTPTPTRFGSAYAVEVGGELLTSTKSSAIVPRPFGRHLRVAAGIDEPHSVDTVDTPGDGDITYWGGNEAVVQ